MALNKTLTKPFGTFFGVQFWWSPHTGFGWLHNTMNDKFKFFYGRGYSYQWYFHRQKQECGSRRYCRMIKNLMM